MIVWVEDCESLSQPFLCGIFLVILQPKALVLTKRPPNVSPTYIQYTRNPHIVAKDWSPVSSMWGFLTFINGTEKIDSS